MKSLIVLAGILCLSQAVPSPMLGYLGNIIGGGIKTAQYYSHQATSNMIGLVNTGATVARQATDKAVGLGKGAIKTGFGATSKAVSGATKLVEVVAERGAELPIPGAGSASRLAVTSAKTASSLIQAALDAGQRGGEKALDLSKAALDAVTDLNERLAYCALSTQQKIMELGLETAETAVKDVHRLEGDELVHLATVTRKPQQQHSLNINYEPINRH